MALHLFIKHRIKLFARCEQGVAYVEFALCIAALLLLFLGSIEVSRIFLIIQKLEKTVSTVTDVVTQTDPNSSPLTVSEMQQLMSAVTDMMSPYSTGASDPNILVIVNDVLADSSGHAKLQWQYCGGGAFAANSAVSTGSGSAAIGAAATMPSGFTINANEEVLIGEVFYKYTPLIASNGVLGNMTIYRTSIFLPRLGALTSFSSHC